MVKPDAVVIALAAVAVIATTVAVMSSADWTSEETYAFAVSTDTVLPEQGPVPAGSAPARFEWPAPDNSTGILATVTVTFQGQAVQGGNAIIRISGTAPDGTQLPVQTRTLAVSGTQQTEGKPYNATWMEVPDKVRDTRDPDGVHWDGPLVIFVSVERPSDVPLASYSFTAQVGGRFVTYDLA